MTFYEAYQKWKETAPKGLICAHGGLEDRREFFCFGQCFHNAHANVGYGKENCPLNCTDFAPVTDCVVFYQTFIRLYKAAPAYYNKLYDLDPNSNLYIKTE